MIGMFDSGVGGLTVLRSIRQYLPSADILYFGDIKNAPYGSKSREELSVLLVAGLKVLHERGAEKIVSACNSVSASLAISLFDALEIAPAHLIEMVGPTVAALRDSPERIAVCATPATIRSGIYADAFRMVGKEIQNIAIEGLAGAIEFGAPEAEIKKHIEGAFTGKSDFDLLVLGCTHYPLAIEAFGTVLPDVKIFDPAEAVAIRARRQFWPQEVGDARTHFLISKESQRFRDLTSSLFPNQKYTVEVLE
ncbi:MAG: aspartate/glutamate racemase family protein [Candidatus Kaiserbacteria bacterium]|nr:MAG: aspartate/glutamate racemase family protein [Candidatus Kaiserbacteria bacterium]